MLLLGAAAAVWLGMICLALSQPEHWRQLFGTRMQTGTVRAVLRSAGVAGLFAALVLCLRADSAAMAVLLFAMLLTAGTLLTAFAVALHGAAFSSPKRSARTLPARD